MRLTPYPNGAAGVKGREVSGFEGRDHITPHLGYRQAEVVADIKANGPANADRIAARIGRHINPTRPRVTELKAMGLIQKTGEIAQTEFGRSQPIFRLSTQEELALHLARKAADPEARHGD